MNSYRALPLTCSEQLSNVDGPAKKDEGTPRVIDLANPPGHHDCDVLAPSIGRLRLKVVDGGIGRPRTSPMPHSSSTCCLEGRDPMNVLTEGAKE
jgi:hypothetical protein